MTLPSHQHHVQPSFTNKVWTLMFTPPCVDSDFIIEMTPILLPFTRFVKAILSRVSIQWCICTRQQHIQGHGLHQKAPEVLIDTHQVSLYKMLVLLQQREKGRWKSPELPLIQHICHRKTEESHTLSPTDPQMWNRYFHVNTLIDTSQLFLYLFLHCV